MFEGEPPNVYFFDSLYLESISGTKKGGRIIKVAGFIYETIAIAINEQVTIELETKRFITITPFIE